MTAVRTSRYRGLTLPEVMIAGTLLLLVLGVSVELTRMAYRTFQHSTQTTEIYRKQINATDLLSRELRLCTALLNPRQVTYDHSYQAGSGDDLLIFRRFSPSLNAETVVSYRYDASERELIRETLQPNYDPRQPWTQQVSGQRSPKVVATEVEEFSFTVENPDQHFGAFLVHFQLETKVGKVTSRVGSTVRVRSI